MKQKGFAECTKCQKWADIPSNFKENIHFVQCPECKGPMYLMRGLNPHDGGLQEKNKVVARVMSQKGLLVM